MSMINEIAVGLYLLLFPLLMIYACYQAKIGNLVKALFLTCIICIFTFLIILN